MASNMKTWRDSAAILLAAKNTILQTTQQTERMNYKLLTMKRSANSKFMPDTHVFPGGSLDKSDCSKDWLNLYEKFGISQNNFDIFKKVKYTAPIFKNDNENSLPRYISLRICAIREAFEECGVLLCKNAKTKNNGNAALWASYFEELDVNEWQNKVHKDASQFIQLCNKFEIYPDIWALHEWSNWLSPAEFKRRFDNIFFIANIKNVINTKAEKSEVQIIQWASATEILERSKNSEVFLPPPQFYELHRLKNFLNIDDLAQYSLNRAINGTQRYLSYRVATETTQITILPGDDLYPGEENCHIPKVEVLDEVPEKNSVHRMYHIGYQNRIALRHYKHEIEHVYPIINNDNAKL